MRRQPPVSTVSRTLISLILSTAFFLSEGRAEISARDLQKAASFSEHGGKILETGDVAKAKAEYEKALVAVASFPDAHLGLGHVAMKEGRFEDALKEYEAAKAGFAELGDAIFDLQVKRYNDTQRQIASLRDSLHNRQTTLNAGRGTGGDNTYVERQIAQLEEAIRRLEAVTMPTKDAPRDPPGEVYFHLGNAQFRLNHLDEALAAWETCAIKSPRFPMVRNNLAVAYWKKGRFDEAKASLARAQELGFPINPQLKADLEKAAEAAKGGAAPPAAATPPTQNPSSGTKPPR